MSNGPKSILKLYLSQLYKTLLTLGFLQSSNDRFFQFYGIVVMTKFSLQGILNRLERNCRYKLDTKRARKAKYSFKISRKVPLRGNYSSSVTNLLLKVIFRNTWFWSVLAARLSFSKMVEQSLPHLRSTFINQTIPKLACATEFLLWNYDRKNIFQLGKLDAKFKTSVLLKSEKRFRGFASENSWRFARTLE